jgi:hypothetical protein
VPPLELEPPEPLALPPPEPLAGEPPVPAPVDVLLQAAIVRKRLKPVTAIGACFRLCRFISSELSATVSALEWAFTSSAFNEIFRPRPSIRSVSTSSLI